MDTMRFKIDLYNSTFRPFGLYFAKRRLLGVDWKHVDSFETKEDAMTFYEKIKDLPQYLP